ncbi:cation:proton antiporter [Halegenticoccus tardaugens]|uniref:cation:proton antiporter n=1 Tax=Halegenticoccus tardaugens TaxID=2071624 RepID=UPI00100B974E|nr:cation:proton antiporter [Halegenticoccus tardaugens]
MAEVSLLQFGGALAAIAAAGALASRVGLSVIPLYVLVGAAVGPSVLGETGLPHVTVAASDYVTLLAEIGIVLLLFFLGLEFSIERLLENRRKLTAVGLLDVAVNFPVGVAIGLVLGWSLLEALLLGGIVYISSSAVITKSLIDLGWIADAESEPILGTLVFEDLFIAVYLAVVSSLVRGGGSLAETGRDVAVAVGFLLALVVAAHYGSAWLERALDVGSNELFVLRALGITVPVAGAALSLGVSEAVAAFFVGMGFSSTVHVERIERLLSPVRDVFAAIFFFWIGLNTDPELVAATAGLLAVAVVLTTPTKLVSGFFGGRMYGLDDRRAVRVGASMVTRGEFSLIIATTAAAGAGPVMTGTIPAFAVGYVLVMSILGTVLMQYSGALEGLVLREPSETTG